MSGLAFVVHFGVVASVEHLPSSVSVHFCPVSLEGTFADLCLLNSVLSVWKYGTFADLCLLNSVQ